METRKSVAAGNFFPVNANSNDLDVISKEHSQFLWVCFSHCKAGKSLREF